MTFTSNVLSKPSTSIQTMKASFSNALIGDDEDDKKKEEAEKKKGVLTRQIKKDDPRAEEFKKKVAEKKASQKELPILNPDRDAEGEGRQIGAEIAKTRGGQFVFVGEFHNNVDQWKVLAGLVEKLKYDARPIIFVDEYMNDPGWKEGFAIWNETLMTDSKRGTFGNVLAKARHYSDVCDMRETMKAITQGDGKRFIPYGDFLNRLSELRPDVLAFMIDTNHDARDAVSGLPDMRYVDRDTAMAMNLKSLREKYPDAIILGSFGAQHVVERQADNRKAKRNNVDDKYVNYNDPMAEQLSIFYGDDKVHTIAALDKGLGFTKNSKQNYVYNNPARYDKVVYINSYDEKTYPWINPWMSLPCDELKKAEPADLQKQT